MRTRETKGLARHAKERSGSRGTGGGRKAGRSKTAAPQTPATPERPPVEHRALMLRTCASDLTAYNGFRWPESGYVEAPDWSPEACCGYGLHGLLWGEGDGRLLNWALDARWLVVEIDAREVVQIDRKVKVPRAWVVYCGDRLGATEYLAQHGGHGRSIVGGTATAGDGGTATAGDDGTATAGDRGTATAGHRGTATAGDGGTATAGVGGELRIRWWDGQRYRTGVFYVGDGGVEPGVAYRCEGGELVKVERSDGGQS